MSDPTAQSEVTEEQACPVCGATYDTDAELQEHFDVC